MTGPIKVCVIDVERCPRVVSGAPRYTALWALVREGRRPCGLIKLPFADGPITQAELRAAIAALPRRTVLAPLRPPPDGELPMISIVIPSLLERPRLLEDCLRSLAALEYPHYEVIVVDNRPPGAEPVELASGRLVRETQPGISAARNRGLAAAVGEIVAFTDDDVVADPAWLLAIALRFRNHPEEDCVTGLVMPRELETAAQVALEDYYGAVGPRTFEPVSHRLRHPPGSGAPLAEAVVDAIGEDGQWRRSFSLYATGTFGTGANMAFRSSALAELGAFDEALGSGTPAGGGEELEMFARLAWRGRRLGFEPAAIVHHTHHRDPGSLRRQIEGWGTGYGALLTAMVLDDPRHLGRMLGTARRAVGVFGRDFARKLSDSDSGNGRRELARLELRGMLHGPAAYLRGRRGPAR